MIGKRNQEEGRKRRNDDEKMNMHAHLGYLPFSPLGGEGEKEEEVEGRGEGRNSKQAKRRGGGGGSEERESRSITKVGEMMEGGILQ